CSLNVLGTVRRLETQHSVLAAGFEPDAAMPHRKPHAALAQAVQPGAQQGRRLHRRREDAAAAADEGVHTEARGPGAHRLRPERAQRRLERLATLVTAEKVPEGLAVRQVQAAAAGEQQLAPD